DAFALPAVRVRGVNQDHALHLVWMLPGEYSGIQTAERMPNQHIRPFDSSVLQQRFQFAGVLLRVTRLRADVTPPQSGAVISANAGTPGNLRLNPHPVGDGPRLKRIEDDRRAALAHTGDV